MQMRRPCVPFVTISEQPFFTAIYDCIVAAAFAGPKNVAVFYGRIIFCFFISFSFLKFKIHHVESFCIDRMQLQYAIRGCIRVRGAD